MTKKMNRIAARQWADERERKYREEVEAQRLKADLDALRKLRDHLLDNWRGEPTDTLKAAIDDYAGVLTGNRTVLWSDNFRHVMDGTGANWSKPGK